MSKNPAAVCISDIHFDVKTLEKATKVVNMALEKAKSLNVPLIIAGDLTDKKEIMSATVTNRLLEIFNEKYLKSIVYIIPGNHDMINEKSDEHALNFLKNNRSVVIVDDFHLSVFGVGFIRYQKDSKEFDKKVRTFAKGSIVIAHQGAYGADSGEYIHDSTAINVNDYSDYRIFSGHYHNHQTIGNYTFIGNPYSLGFGESGDHAKGFIVVNADGTFEHVDTNMPRHIKIDYKKLDNTVINDNNLYWVTVSGFYDEVKDITKELIATKYFKHNNFRFDKEIITLTNLTEKNEELPKNNLDIFDNVIDKTVKIGETRDRLKKLWKSVFYGEPRNET